jgi:hypothetical protein
MLLPFSVVCSVVLLGIACATGRAKSPLGPMICSGLVFGLGTALCGLMFLPAVALQALLLVVVAAVAQFAGWRGWRFVAMSCAATLAAYAIVGGFAFHQLSQLRDRVPYVSMEERLPLSSSYGEKGCANEPDQPTQIVAPEQALSAAPPLAIRHSCGMSQREHWSGTELDASVLGPLAERHPLGGPQSVPQGRGGRSPDRWQCNSLPETDRRCRLVGAD